MWRRRIRTHVVAWLCGSIALSIGIRLGSYYEPRSYGSRPYFFSSPPHESFEALLGELSHLALGALIFVGVFHITAGLSLLGVLACLRLRAWYMLVAGAVVSTAFWFLIFAAFADFFTFGQGDTSQWVTTAACRRALGDPLFFPIYGLPAMSWGIAYWVAKRSALFDHSQRGIES